ncbi:MAG: hypothetical protein H6714_09590 [Myxococcales bacterium]|nr:hypothetical protein [Myxococcales bacterium]
MSLGSFGRTYIVLMILGVVAGCSTAKKPSPDASLSASLPTERVAKAEPALGQKMHVFFEETMRARDALVDGDVASARQSLGKLASISFDGTSMPAGWAPELARWRAMARIGSQSQQLEEVAVSVSQMGAQCGRCHQTLGKGPKYEASGWVEDTEDLGAHMFLLMWASDRMWEGLTEPWDRAWQVGAQTLVEAPIKMKALGKKLGPRAARAREYAQALKKAGETALLEEDPASRADGFANVLLTCASCHSAVRKTSAP